MHLPGPLRHPRAQGQPRPSNFRPFLILLSTAAPRPGRGAVRLECGGLPPLFFHPQPEPHTLPSLNPQQLAITNLDGETVLLDAALLAN